MQIVVLDMLLGNQDNLLHIKHSMNIVGHDMLEHNLDNLENTKDLRYIVE